MINETKTILIIEDDLIIAENIKEHLTTLGFNKAFIAKDYSSTKLLATKIKPDIFLVDIKLKNSEKDGIDTMLSLFPNHINPLIYISTVTDNETRDRAKKTNPTAYLVKPFSQKQLEVAIDFAFSKEIEKSMNGNNNVTIDHCPFISELDFFYVKVKDKYERVNKSEIVALQSQGTYTDIITTNKTITHYLNLGLMIDKINSRSIVRCHNSYAVNIKFISAYDNESLYVVGGKDVISLPIGNTYRGDVMERMPRL